MHIIIAGCGKAGSTLVRQLSMEGHDITIIDTKQRVIDSIIERFDIMAITGNCATMSVLEQAGVEKADLLIATASDDECNLLCCMTSHALNPNLHTIARIRNPEYSEQIYRMKDLFALSLMVNPEKEAALNIERLLRFPGFLKRETFAKDRVEIVELKIDESSILNGVSLNELDDIVKCQVLVCTVLRGDTAIMPDGDFILQTDDHIFVTAPTNVLTNLLKNLGIITHKVNRVMLAGGGRVSFYLAQQLEKLGIHVLIIENDYERCVQLANLLPRCNIIHGDASSQNILESEGLDECDALVTLTGFDELNILISLFATERNIPQVITKLGHADHMSILNRLPLGSMISPKELCCNTIVRYVRAMKNQTGAAISVHSIASGQAEAIEFLVDANTKHCNEPLKKLRTKKNV